LLEVIIGLYFEVAMAVSLNDFRATLRLTWIDHNGRGEKIFSYWNNDAVTFDLCNRDEVLHIVRSQEGDFLLEISNLCHTGTLEELEKLLYGWAQDEGWFDRAIHVK